MQPPKLSLCLTNYNRYELLLKSFEKVLHDDRIFEIVVVDDCSREEIFQLLFTKVAELNQTCDNKIKLYRNDENLGMSLNKKRAIELSTNEWCIIFDSDNEIDVNYLDALYEESENYFFFNESGMRFGNGPSIIFAPSGALPNFDYSKYEGCEFFVSSNSIFHPKTYINHKDFDCLLNTCNYVVNREFYLKTYVYNPTVKESDTIWHNYNHFKAGGSIYVIPGMTYQHLVHADSGWLQNAQENTEKANQIKELIKQL